MKSRTLPCRWISALAAGCLALPGPATAAKRTPTVRASLEFTLQNRAALATVEAVVADAGVATGRPQPVSDMVLFVSKAGRDVEAALLAENGQPVDASGLLNARLFVVAGGRLYTAARGQCGGWQNDVVLCSATCDGGTFALRRRASAPLELLLGAIPGASGLAKPGATISACDFEAGGETRLVPKAGRGLAVLGFEGE